MTIIQVAARWKAEGQFPFQIHFAGDGTQFEKLVSESRRLELLAVPSEATRPGASRTGSSRKLKLIDSERIVFHGQLKRDAVNQLLLSSNLALVPNRPESLVACPYKAGEYAAAGLPILSCLGGELGDLLRKWNAGSGYNEGDVDSLHATFEGYSTELAQLNRQSLNVRKMAEALFDRKKTYPALANVITY